MSAPPRSTTCCRSTGPPHRSRRHARGGPAARSVPDARGPRGLLSEAASAAAAAATPPRRLTHRCPANAGSRCGPATMLHHPGADPSRDPGHHRRMNDQRPVQAVSAPSACAERSWGTPSRSGIRPGPGGGARSRNRTARGRRRCRRAAGWPMALRKNPLKAGVDRASASFKRLSSEADEGRVTVVRSHPGRIRDRHCRGAVAPARSSVRDHQIRLTPR